jgi:chromate transporter
MFAARLGEQGVSGVIDRGRPHPAACYEALAGNATAGAPEYDPRCVSATRVNFSSAAAAGSAAEVFRAALKLGCTSFGGPVAHIGYFERAYVERLGWLSAAEYTSIVALCQILPGPSSSQVGFLIGHHRAGWRGALAAWAGFTLPSAILMYLFAVLSLRVHGAITQAVVHGLMLTAVAVVGQALFSMARSLCPDFPRAVIALAAAALLVVRGGPAVQLTVIAVGALAGWLLCRAVPGSELASPAAVSLRSAWILLGIFGVLFLLLPVLGALNPRGSAELAAIFYRAGALVFGGGHVVLPLLRDALVPDGWVSDDAFLTGYGFAQALPGPLFTLAAYLGAVCAPANLRMLWAALALAAIFLPGLLLALAGASLLKALARIPRALAVLAGINAAVVGILAAAFYDPVCITAIRGSADAAVAAAGVVLLIRFKTPPVLIAALCVVAAVGLSRLR